MLISHFRRYKAGWWLLHAAAIPLTFWLGHLVRIR
jgi:hypothetical protein